MLKLSLPEIRALAIENPETPVFNIFLIFSFIFLISHYIFNIKTGKK